MRDDYGLMSPRCDIDASPGEQRRQALVDLKGIVNQEPGLVNFLARYIVDALALSRQLEAQLDGAQVDLAAARKAAELWKARAVGDGVGTMSNCCGAEVVHWVGDRTKLGKPHCSKCGKAAGARVA